ncbi:MAG: pyridoxamine 5'-phosphate oxidase [Acidimicrobiia bacterium]
MIADEVARLRAEYETAGLVESEMADDPFTQFQEWFAGVLESGLPEPNAFVLATVDSNGAPSARALLMKDLTPEGLVFYTGMGSRKSEAMRSSGLAAATFVWIPLHRQIRFEGTVSQVEAEKADAYFATRPRGAQLAAHASRQSEKVSGRAELDERYRESQSVFGDGEIPRPAHWGGWQLSPTTVEFWQGRPNRFHDRIVYRLERDSWVKERLAP